MEYYILDKSHFPTMDIIMYIAVFAVSLFVLLQAADKFIEAAERIGLSFGISPFIIGITIVAFGTSLPELATSIAAVLDGESEIVVGNVIGSNIANISLVLGMVALAVRKVDMSYNLWKIDISFFLGTAFLLFLALLDGEFTLLESLIFLLFLGTFLIYSIFQSDDNEEPAEKQEKVTSKPLDYLILIVGGAAVAISADYTIWGISGISQSFGVSPEIIAQSAVAIGTSLPEVIVSIKSAKKGKTEIAIGNVLGSNVFNILFVMSIPSFFGTLSIPADVTAFSLPFMIVLSVLFTIMTNDRKIILFEGVILLVFYVYYILSLFI